MIQDPVEIRHLRYFMAVARAGSFTRAANRLGISQPSVSQQMRELEANLRISLFQRRGKRILLTSAGLIFQEHARAILRQFENFLDELSSGSAELRGADAVANFFSGRAQAARPALIGGSLGLAVIADGVRRFALEVIVSAGRIIAIETVADPERLRELDIVLLDD